MRSFWLVLLVIGALSGCQKEEQAALAAGIDFYILTSLQRVDQSCQIDESKIVTEDKPFISYSELLSYDSAGYTFEISAGARARIQDPDHPVHGRAFAVKAGRQLIYTGYFWSGYSSASCDWVTIDAVLPDRGMTVRLGYPGLIDGQVIPDRRNDPLLLQILERDRKLIR